MEEEMNLDIYAETSRSHTLGELINELNKFDPATPVKLICDHSSAQIRSNGEAGALHRVHLDLDFEYVSKIVTN